MPMYFCCRYAVIPLSPNHGISGWVPHCDTLHDLIRDFRESRKVMLNVEQRLVGGDVVWCMYALFFSLQSYLN
jgi:phosphatidylinositol kinase/protein kinase (PI-3  family)